MNQMINDCLASLNRVGDIFYSHAAATFIQATLLVVVLFCIDLLLRKRVRSVFRYCLWLLVLVKLVLPPTISLPTGIGYWAGDMLPPALEASHWAQDEIYFGEMSAHGQPMGVSKVKHIQSSESKNAMGTSETSVSVRITWRALLFLFWLMGVGVFLAMLKRRAGYVRALIVASTPADKNMQRLLARCCQQIGWQRHVELRVTDAVSSPAVCGCHRPTVLIPVRLLNKLSPEGLRSALIHELVHIKRGDLWINGIQMLIQVVYFYNPFIWFANAIIRRVCEEAVDETVLVTLGGDAEDYSDTLLDISETVFQRSILGLRLIGVVESEKALKWRIKHMLNRPTPTTSKLGVLGLSTILVIAAVLLPMAKAEKPTPDNGPVATENQEKHTKTIHEAAADGDLEQIKVLLAKGSDVDTRDKDGWTPLHVAAQKGHKDVIKLLIVRGANVNAETNRWEATPLRMVGNRRDVAELLIANGADVNLRAFDGDRPLLRAVRDGARDVVELYIAKGADISEQAWAGATNTAASWGHKDVLELLVDKGSYISSFHRAAFIGDLPRVETSIAEGTDINTRDVCGWTPLVWAIHGHQPDVVAFLISRGADVNVTDKDDTDEDEIGKGALHYAAIYGYVKVAELLVAKGADVNAKGGKYDVTPLHCAADRGHTAVVELLIGEGADVNAHQNTGHTVLQQAAQGGHIDVVELLISKGADIEAADNWNVTPLYAAVRSNHPEIVKLLLNRGANRNVRIKSGRFDGSTPLHRAISEGYQDIVELLIAKGADINTKNKAGLTPLHKAAQIGQKDVVELLLTKGADFKTQDSNGRTAVGFAKEKSHTEIVELLRKHAKQSGDPKEIMTLYDYAALGDIEQVKSLILEGINVNTKSQSGMTALAWAVLYGHQDIAELLIQRGADVNVAPRTPLHLACQRGNKELAEWLIDRGADINKESESGLTPLHLAAKRGRKDIVELLIAKGAHVNVKDNADHTPLDLAEQREHIEIVGLLKKHGAKE